MKRLLILGAVLIPALASAQPIPNPMPPCDSPQMSAMMIHELDRMLYSRGVSVIKMTGTPHSFGWNPYRAVGGCEIAFQNSDGDFMTGIFSYHINLLHQLIASFQDMTPPR